MSKKVVCTRWLIDIWLEYEIRPFVCCLLFICFTKIYYWWYFLYSVTPYYTNTPMKYNSLDSYEILFRCKHEFRFTLLDSTFLDLLLQIRLLDSFWILPVLDTISLSFYLHWPCVSSIFYILYSLFVGLWSGVFRNIRYSLSVFFLSSSVTPLTENTSCSLLFPYCMMSMPLSLLSPKIYIKTFLLRGS